MARLICPNPECLNRKRTGHAAEFRAGVTHCSDCGTPLVTEEVPQPAAAPAAGSSARGPWGRLLVTLGVVAGLFALGRVPLPRVDREALAGILAAAGPLDWAALSDRFGLLALGLGSMLSAFQLVELIALAVPRLRARRVSGPGPRSGLTTASLLLGLGLSAVQAHFLYLWLASIGVSYRTLGEPVDPGLVTEALIVLALVAGVLVLSEGAFFISRRGLGNGFSWLLASATAGALLQSLAKLLAAVRGEQIGPGNLVLSGLVGPALVVYATARLLRARPVLAPSEGALPLQLSLPTCGLHPPYLAASLLLLPAQLANFGVAPARLVAALVPGSAIYLAGDLILICITGALLTALFYHPAIVSRCHAALSQTGSVEPALQSALSRALPRAAGWSLGYFGALAVLQHLFPLWLLPSLELMLLTAVFLDLREEWRARRGRTLVKVWELHRLYALAPVEHLLRARGIIPCLRGRHHRALLYFFGPFVPVDVLVPADQEDEARELLAGQTWSAGR